jgi:predicted DNA-binding protein (UPF0251 family)
MPRPVKYRCVELVPQITFFQPIGVPLGSCEQVILSIEEVEAIRLKDLDGLDQEESAQRMHVSRATFQRVLDSARRKMAEALIQGKAIRMAGGNFELAIRRFRCADHGHEWDVPFGVAEDFCPTCLSTNIRRIDLKSSERG